MKLSDDKCYLGVEYIIIKFKLYYKGNMHKYRLIRKLGEGTFSEVLKA